MIRLVEDQTPWQDSMLFASAFNEALAESIDNDLRIQLGAQHELFAVNPGAQVPVLKVTPDEAGVTIDAGAPPFQGGMWFDTIKRSVRERVGDPPLERAQEIVDQKDPNASTKTPRGTA